MSELIIIKANKNNDKIIKSAAYCRVSSEKDAQFGSYSAQIEHYTNLIKGDKNAELVEIYADRESGTSADKRDDFQRMISDCRKGKIDRIYTKSVSRFARNTKESLTVLRELKSLGVTVKFEKENLDTASLTNETMLTLHSIFAQQESDSISKNIKWSVEKSMKNGTYHNGSAPYGYRYEDRKLVICEDEAEIIRKIFKLYLDGNGSHRIVQILENEGGGKWSVKTVHSVIKQEKYCGDLKLQKCYVAEHKKLKNNGAKHQYYIKDHHEPIISREDFETAQKLLAERNERCDRTVRKPQFFSRMLICEQCGSILQQGTAHGKLYWQCPHHTKLKTCDLKLIADSKLMTASKNLITKLIIAKEKIILPMLKQLENAESRINSGNTAITEIQIEIAKLKDKNHIYSQLKLQGMLDDALYAEQTNAITTQLLELQKKLNQLRNSDSAGTISELKQLVKLIDDIDYDSFNGDLFKQIVRKIYFPNKYQPGSVRQANFELLGGLVFTEEME